MQERIEQNALELLHAIREHHPDIYAGAWVVVANHSDEHFRGVNCTLNLVNKVHTWLCQIDVVEDPVLAKVLNEPIC
jgi:hypothetical protein